MINGGESANFVHYYAYGGGAIIAVFVI